MIQDIEPYKYDNTFYQKEPNDDDFILIFENDKIILSFESGSIINNHVLIKIIHVII